MRAVHTLNFATCFFVDLIYKRNIELFVVVCMVPVWCLIEVESFLPSTDFFGAEITTWRLLDFPRVIHFCPLTPRARATRVTRPQTRVDFDWSNETKASINQTFFLLFQSRQQ